MHYFYAPDINGDNYTLPEEESKHSVRVLRLQKGDRIQLTDGKGGLYTAVITDDNVKRCTVKIEKVIKEYGKRDFYLHIGIAPTKMLDRMEWFLEKATEMGIEEISPILCDRSERKELKTERMNRILVSAMKQSIKAYIPKLNEIKPLKRLIGETEAEIKLIAHCYDTAKKKLKEEYKPGKNVLILIGPEGDFSPEEIELAVKNGYTPVSLGSSRLRTETAALVACNTINLLNE
jgi:16S rRNA (uracil1498-N3)-methyltransferase